MIQGAITIRLALAALTAMWTPLWCHCSLQALAGAPATAIVQDQQPADPAHHCCAATRQGADTDPCGTADSSASKHPSPCGKDPGPNYVDSKPDKTSNPVLALAMAEALGTSLYAVVAPQTVGVVSGCDGLDPPPAQDLVTLCCLLTI